MNRYIQLKIKNMGWILALSGFVLSAPSAFAALGACPAANTTLNLISTGTFPPNTGMNGCATVDANFSNFVVGTSVATSINTVVLNPGGIYATIVVPATAIVLRASTANPGQILLNSFGPAAGDPFCDPNSGSGGWCVNDQALKAVFSQITYTATYFSAITTLGISIRAVSHSSGQTDGASVAFREFCIGFANFSDVGANCGVGQANYRVVQAGVLAGQNLDQTFRAAISFTPNTLFAIRDTIYVHNSGANGSYGTILDFDSFDTPEPATFGLMGTALLGLALLARRRAIK